MIDQFQNHVGFTHQSQSLSEFFLNPGRYLTGIFLLMFFWLPPAGLSAQEPGQDLKQPINTPLFASDEPLEVTIEADFKKLVATKDAEEPYYDTARLTLTGMNSGQSEFSIKVRARGYSRRVSLCDFPPLLLDFKKDDVSGTVFEGQNKLKLVTYCKDMDRYQEYVFHEYLIYKVYNILTDTSLRVRLTHINYIDRSRDRSVAENYGFLIEDIDELAERLGGEETDRLVPIHDLCDHTALDRFTIFQYMISNVDWNIGQPMSHNVKLIIIGDSQPIPIPYDFDFCGMINTSYAAAPPNLPIQSVRQRFFRGFCRKKGEYEKTIQIFIDHKDEIYKLYGEFPYLSESVKKTALKFYDQFYDVITNPKKIQREINEACPVNHKHLYEM